MRRYKKTGKPVHFGTRKHGALRQWIAAALCAMMLAGCAAGAGGGTPQGGAGASQGGNGTSQQGGSVTTNGVTAHVVSYPGAGDYDDFDAETFMETDAHWEWWSAYREAVEASEAVQDGMDDYYAALLGALMNAEHADDADDNAVCSPVNIYIALAMLAECTDGNTRQQIMDVLQVKDIGALRTRIAALWAANYADTPVLTSLLANSVWMRDALTYNEETLSTLMREYYASSFAGQMGSQEMDSALQTWTDDNTGGLLTDYTSDLSLPAECVLALVSTIYFKAGWVDTFYEGATNKQTFHGTDGDSEVDMMHRSDSMSYFEGDDFTAVALPLNDSGKMYFVLPEEGKNVRDLIADEDVLSLVRTYGKDTPSRHLLVNLSIPRFKVDGQINLIDPMARLGITDALDTRTADFTPLTEEIDELAVSDALHAALVEIDEEGVTGAAFTIIMIAEGAMEVDPEEIDFTLDRPFLFYVTGRDDSILFAGIVQHVD